MADPFNRDVSNGSNNDNNDRNQDNNYRYDSYRPSADQTPSQNQTEWQGDCYHSYKAPGAPSRDSSYSTYSTPDHSSSNYSNYAAPPPSDYPVYGNPAEPPKPKKAKRKHTAAKVVAAVLACVVVSAGSVAGFATLVNNGTVKMSLGSTTPAFTIVKNSASTSSAAATTNTAAAGNLTLEAVAKKVLPSVVCIQNYQVAQNSSTFTIGGFGNGGNGSNGSDGSSGDGSAAGVSPTSEGSGIIATSDGYIITNAHVVDSASSLKVILSNGKTYQAKLVGSDSITDLAIIKIDATGLTAAEFGSSNDLQVADQVMAIGNPGGMEFNSSVTVGYVSALNREITNSDTGYTMKTIQTDAAINPGNSGGALVNMKGQIIGINSSKIVATGYEGLGFAIPIDEAQPIISELKQYGYVKDRAVLGITGQYIDSMTSRIYGLPTGMYVASVTSSAVSNAGIQKGDVITKIDGTAVTSQNTVTTVITSKKPGDTVTLTVTRALTGQTFTASVKLSQATGK